VCQGADGIHHGLFGHGVERAGGFVIHHHLGVVIQRAGDSNALALDAREAHAALADEGFMMGWQIFHDEVVYLRHARAALELCTITLRLWDFERGVFGNAGIGLEVLLRHIADRLAQGAQLGVRPRHVIDDFGSLCGAQQAEQDIHQSGFA
jgi:hypothetical protein